MSDTPQAMPTEPKGDPDTLARFRRQTLWGVTVPVVVVALLMIAAVVLLIVLGGPGAVSIVADYALILLVLACIVPVLLGLALWGGLAFLTGKLVKTVPPYSYKLRRVMEKVYETVDRITDRIASIFITVESAMAGVSAALNKDD